MNKTNELIKTTRNLFSLNLVVVLYILLTILTITQVQLVLNSVVKLPIFNVEINVTTFFFLAPLTLLILFIYFFIHLDKVIERPKEQNSDLSNWLILESFQTSENNSNNDSSLFKALEKLVGGFLIWWLLPIANAGIIYRTVYTHQDSLIFLIFVVTSVTNLLLLIFYCVIQNKTFKWRMSLFISLITFTILYILFEGSLFETLIHTQLRLEILYLALVIICLAMIFIYFYSKLRSPSLKILGLIWILILLTPFIFWYHYSFVAKVGEKKNISLNGLVLNDNINAKIDLRGKKLDGADLTGVTLTNAILKGADLRKTSLSYANLDGSDFEKALLDSATFKRASMLNIKNLTLEQLSKVKTLYEAKFDSTMDSIISKLRTEKLYLFKEPEDEIYRINTNCLTPPD